VVEPREYPQLGPTRLRLAKRDSRLCCGYGAWALVDGVEPERNSSMISRARVHARARKTVSIRGLLNPKAGNALLRRLLFEERFDMAAILPSVWDA
jgi:hypothetical protein